MQPRALDFENEVKSEVKYQSTYANLLSKFKSGDLVYGLSQVRALAIIELNNNNFSSCIANALNNRTVTLVLNNGDTTDLNNFKQAHAAFLHKNREYLKKPGGKPVPTLAYKGNIRSIAYRRACKLLLVEDSDERTRTVHVLTENINWERVCTKICNDKSGNPVADLSVTSSEMRAAYRYYRTHGKNHPLIIFYDKEGEVLEKMPWEQPALMPFFQEYDRQHQLKIDLENAPTQSQDDEDLTTVTPSSPRLA